MKKMIALGLFAAMLLCMVGTMAGCSEGKTLFEGNTYSLNEDGESYTLANLSEDYTGTEFVVPNDIDGKPVTAIGNAAFAYHFPNLTSVTLSDNITMIDLNAFRDCTGLKTVNLSDKVTVIGEQAFMGCSSLTEIELPDGVTTIGRLAFDGCESLASINIPTSVTTIGDGAFEGCKSLTTMTIPEGVTTIESLVFSECSSMKTITIPKSVTSIDATWSFYGCTSLERIDFGGTKEEWMQASDTDETYAWACKINCSDGTIGDTVVDE